MSPFPPFPRKRRGPAGPRRRPACKGRPAPGGLCAFCRIICNLGTKRFFCKKNFCAPKKTL
ncbi:hypothetical protein ASJ35_14380 [Ruthenibacterium lactatiformans]|uniref:Uncharacterized protein n=1 Tax=Ruthenibacterium lactatiformans TaxID=1550024 RepID=A0A0D8J151_9FIRM|nr:hypothetical protein TQ39_05665 [Ruthenibacterium lactatiformans]KUE75379.1 hypothetical protein ASJ35_14380 [Ruthenibacterium lactatiformans]RJV97325.1 hypothetical protein DWW15_12175 [Subdoligranulum sp. AF14-43]RJW80827.1 hypothetical protein DXA32_13640 [Subdoligranulum sp. OF01-18]